MIVTRPLSIGELFDRAVTLVVRRRRAVLRLGLAVALPLSLAELLEAYGGTNSGAHVLRALATFGGALAAFYASAGIAIVIAGNRDDPGLRAVVGAVSARFWPLIRVGLLTAVVFSVTFAIAAAAVAFALAASGPVGGAIVAVPVGLAAVPVFFTMELAYTVAVLERVGAAAAVRVAWRRAFREGFWRTWLLGLAVTLAYLGPFVVIESATGLVVKVPGWAWVSAVSTFVEYATAFVFFNAVLAVASVDYRVRQEGFDLEAALDAPQPA